MMILAIDPGVTTGLVTARLNLVQDKLWLFPKQNKWSPLKLYQEIDELDPSLILCEDFEFRPKSPVGLVMTSAHLIGVVMMWCEKNKCELRMQNAAYAKTGFYSKIENMKELGAYVGGTNYEHSMDAMRHFLQWFYFGPGAKYSIGKKFEVELVK